MSSASTQPHTRLKEGEIRLLHLAPGTFHETINMRLHRATLSPKLRYEALSYVWGTELSSYQTLVNGLSKEITANLDCALRYLRDPSESRIVWIDAICINQRDIIERNNQVTAMRKIYSLASQVVIWLGPEGDEKHVGRLFNLITNACPEVFDGHLLHQMKLIVARPWFTRVWVVQELALARHAIVQLGAHIATWEQFQILFQTVWSSPEIDIQYDIQWYLPVSFLNRLRIECQTKRTASLSNNLVLSAHLSATDPRDKIFGLLGLCSPSEDGWHGRLTVDYAKTTQEVYTRAVAAILDTGDLSIYSNVPLRPNKKTIVNRVNRTQGLPSWVPDFAGKCSSVIHSTTRDDILHLPMFFQTEDRPHKAGTIRDCKRAHESLSNPTLHFSPDMTILYSKGFCLGTITSASLFTLTFASPRNALSAIFEIYGTLAKDRKIDLTRFLSLVAESDFNPKEHADAIQEILDFPEDVDCLIDEICEDVQVERGRILYNFARSVTGKCLDQTIFVTGSRRLGRIYYHDPNDSVKIGDIVVGLFGVNLPFVLRPNENGTYRILNLAFILDHECKHDFLHNVGEGATWEEFEQYGIKEYAIV